MRSRRSASNNFRETPRSLREVLAVFSLQYGNLPPATPVIASQHFIRGSRGSLDLGSLRRTNKTLEGRVCDAAEGGDRSSREKVERTRQSCSEAHPWNAPMLEASDYFPGLI
ncbi:hypothetical protein E2C01_017440 [Portunus trituberculatus]|uniref:Uncharacterized protein n=1 Tax=Portunus trituberculatus TaxID=210409 RepID=A0A5B7DTG3_PORTR|nr:hypothetical protein [Portunus trituberculatus]